MLCTSVVQNFNIWHLFEHANTLHSQQYHMIIVFTLLLNIMTVGIIDVNGMVILFATTAMSVIFSLKKDAAENAVNVIIKCQFN